MSIRHREALVAHDDRKRRSASIEAFRPEHPVLSRLPRVAGGVRQGNVIPRSVNAELYDAEMLVELAMSRASDIEAEVDAAVEEARERGHAAGMADAERRLAERLHQVERDIASFYRGTEDTILELVIAVTRRLVGERLTFDDARDLTAETIARHLDSRPYAIHVGEDAVRTTEEAIGVLRRSHPDITMPLIKIDPRLPAGRSVLVTQFGTVDLDIESQLEAIRAGLA